MSLSHRRATQAESQATDTPKATPLQAQDSGSEPRSREGEPVNPDTQASTHDDTAEHQGSVEWPVRGKDGKANN